jgi:hypothetical protein
MNDEEKTVPVRHAIDAIKAELGKVYQERDRVALKLAQLDAAAQAFRDALSAVESAAAKQ